MVEPEPAALRQIPRSEYGCGTFGCGWPSNITYPMMLFWIWLYFLVPVGLLLMLVVAFSRRDRKGRPVRRTSA